MTPDEITQIADAVEEIVGRRMEEVYATIEELRQGVADAVVSVNATAQVLHDNDTAIMARLMQDEGSAPAEFIETAAEGWRRFVVGEAKRLGVKIMVAKGDG